LTQVILSNLILKKVINQWWWIYFICSFYHIKGKFKKLYQRKKRKIQKKA